MLRSELVQQLASSRRIPTSQAELVVTLIFSAMAQALEEGERIEIRGFGSFTVRDYAGYMGRNPKTGERVWVPPKRLPFFKVGKELAQRVDDDPAR